jgi:hypothetical protein
MNNERRTYVVAHTETGEHCTVLAVSIRNAFALSGVCFRMYEGDAVGARHALGRKACVQTLWSDEASAMWPTKDPKARGMIIALDGSDDMYAVYPVEPVRLTIDGLPRVHETREEWLAAWLMHASDMVFARKGLPTLDTDKVRASIGFPSTGARGSVLGECYHSVCTTDGTREIFVRPDMIHRDLRSLLPTLVHEILHAVLPDGEGHGPTFRKVMPLLGITGKATATVASADFGRIWQDVMDACGEYPASEFTWTYRPKQRCRQMKMSCRYDECESYDPEKGEGYITRASTSSILRYGATVCPACGRPMVPEDGELAQALRYGWTTIDGEGE